MLAPQPHYFINNGESGLPGVAAQHSPENVPGGPGLVRPGGKVQKAERQVRGHEPLATPNEP
jgi:hypothetical protein